MSKEKDNNQNSLTVEELINKYGTYEVQETADTENEYPKIAQGIPKDNKNKRP